MNSSNFGFEELDLWKKVRELKKEIKMLTKKNPSEKKLRFVDQVIKSSRSINALIS